MKWEERVELNVDLQNAILNLTVNQYFVFHYIFVLEYTHEELSELLGCSSQAVSDSVARIKETLKAHLSEYLD
jgi:RNA polymerase sigma factor (sigma-70 family)